MSSPYRLIRTATAMIWFSLLCTAARGADDSLTQEAAAEQIKDIEITIPNMVDSALDPAGPPATTAVGLSGGGPQPGKLLAIPVPSREPVFGWGLDLFVGSFLDLDKENPDTPPSRVGAMASYMQNDTWALGGGGRLNLMDDRVRVDAAVMYADINYRFWGTGGEGTGNDDYIKVNQKMPVAYANARYEILPETYLGLGVLYASTDLKFDLRGDSPPPGAEDVDEKLSIAAIEIPLEYDSRSSQQYPRDGWFAEGHGVIYNKAMGGDFDTETIKLSANRYLTLRERDVLALRVMTAYAGDDTPFFLQPSIGGRKDMRGYSWGRYIDRVSYTVQGEYRRQPHENWVVTGFVGAGEVARSYGKLFENVLPAAGIGGRYMLKQFYDLTIGADVAWGEHGAHFYFAIGEAF